MTEENSAIALGRGFDAMAKVNDRSACASSSGRFGLYCSLAMTAKGVAMTNTASDTPAVKRMRVARRVFVPLIPTLVTPF